LIIEKITGCSAEIEIHRHVIDPCGLHSTYLEGFQEGYPDRLPNHYHYATNIFRSVAGVSPFFHELPNDLINASISNLSVEWVTGGMVSTSLDLVKLALAIREGRLLSPSAIKSLHTCLPAGPEAMVSHGLFQF
jgi:D-alanyl-D-alanine carboxypeptidase